MDKLMLQLVDFVEGTQYASLPEAVVQETKRVILDIIGCAIAGLSSERGKIVVGLARRLGGVGESSIMGLGDKVSSTNAAFANGELANALDYDALCILSGIHSPPNVIPAQLAAAESVKASGKDLILATAISMEIANRLRAATSPFFGYVTEGPDRGLTKSPVLVKGHGTSAIGAAAGVSRILKLDRGRMANAMGIAAYICPPMTESKWMDTTPCSMTKYGPPGWTNQAGVTAALLADMGYLGDTDAFDGKYGFGVFCGAQQWKPDEAFEGLGKTWTSIEMSYKRYPAGYCMEPYIGTFAQIMEENDLHPEDIEKVNAMGFPVSRSKLWRENRLKTEEDIAFNAPYLIACVAHGIKQADWIDADVRKDAKILEFAKKVEIILDSDAEKEYGIAKMEDRFKTVTKVQVRSKGKTFEKKSSYYRGTPHPEEFRMKDEELCEKFRNNASRVLPSRKVAKALESIFELEKLEDVAELIETVTL